MISLKMDVYPSDHAEVSLTIDGRTFRQSVSPSRFGAIKEDEGTRLIVDQMWDHISQPDEWEGEGVQLCEVIDLMILQVMQDYKALSKDFGTADYREGN